MLAVPFMIRLLLLLKAYRQKMQEGTGDMSGPAALAVSDAGACHGAKLAVSQC